MIAFLVQHVSCKFQVTTKFRPFLSLSLFVSCVFNFSLGDFKFAISSADGSELWLSTDAYPKNARKIAYLGEVRQK